MDCARLRSLAIVGASWIVAPRLTFAQAPTINSQMRHARGQNVVPIYEGWYEDAAGRVHASYGYVNLKPRGDAQYPGWPGQCHWARSR